MDEQKRLVLALVLMAVIVAAMTWLWPWFTGTQQGGGGRPSDGAAQVDGGGGDAGPAEAEPAQPEQGEAEVAEQPARELFPEQVLTLRSPELVVEVNTRGGGVVKAQLLDRRFREGRGKAARQIDLVSVDLEAHPEMMPLAFTLVQKQPLWPASGQSAEGLGVLRLVNHGDVTAGALVEVAEVGADTASKLVSARPFASLADLEKALGGSAPQRQAVLGRLLKAAWQSGFVRLDFEVLRASDTEAVLRARTDGGVEVVRTLSLIGDFELRVRDELRNTGTRQLNLRERLTTSERELETKSGGWFQRPVGQLSGICLAGDDMVRSTRSSLSGEGNGCGGCMTCGANGPSGPQDRSGAIRFTAVDRHYFMTAMSPSDAWGEASCQLRANGGGELQVSLEPVMFTEVPPGHRAAYVSTTYFGPKDYNLLRRLGPGRELWRAIDYGWFAPLSHILLWALRLFYGWIGNWGLAVILLTLLVKGLLLPITHKSMMSMRKMQAEMAQFKPQLDEINERYKDKPDVKNQKIMEFYQQAGINPLKGMAGGCLPMFLQMPIWIALYRMISESVELYQAPFYLWLTDLSARDPYYILPALLGVAMLVQQFLTPQPAGMDNTQQKMMRWMMPIMFLFIMLNMPSGLTLYILANTLLTIVQQQFINRMVPAGVPVVVKGPSSPKPKDGDASTKAKPKRRKRK